MTFRNSESEVDPHALSDNDLLTLFEQTHPEELGWTIFRALHGAREDAEKMEACVSISWLDKLKVGSHCLFDVHPDKLTSADGALVQQCMSVATREAILKAFDFEQRIGIDAAGSQPKRK